MKIPPEVLDAVMKHRAAVRSEWSTVSGVAELAEAHGFLPLSADMGGVAGLTADGRVVEIGWDADAPTTITSARWQDIHLLAGAKRYPELRASIPRRPAQAKDCDQCAGTGTFSVNGQAVIGVTCQCGGLGWIPPEWDR